VLRLDNRHRSRVIVKVAEPIVLFSVPLGTIDDSIGNREVCTAPCSSSRRLHAHRVRRSRASACGSAPRWQTENLNPSEFQAIIDDLT